MKNGEFNPSYCQMLWADFGRSVYRFEFSKAYKSWKLLKSVNYLQK